MINTLAQVALEVTVVNDVDPLMVEVGHRYWAFDSFNSDTGRPQWKETASAIGADGGIAAHLAAGAAVRAVLPGWTCPKCAQPLALSSRHAWEKIIRGEETDRCIECNDSAQAHISRITKPASVRTRQAWVAQKADQKRMQHLFQLRRQAQRLELEEHFAVSLVPDQEIPDASVRTELITLALLSYAPRSAPIDPIKNGLFLYIQEGLPSRHIVSATLFTRD